MTQPSALVAFNWSIEATSAGYFARIELDSAPGDNITITIRSQSFLTFFYGLCVLTSPLASRMSAQIISFLLFFSRRVLRDSAFNTSLILAFSPSTGLSSKFKAYTSQIQSFASAAILTGFGQYLFVSTFHTTRTTALLPLCDNRLRQNCVPTGSV